MNAGPGREPGAGPRGFVAAQRSRIALAGVLGLYFAVLQFALGGRYALSKRTGFYAVWSRILADNAVGDYGGGYDVADSSTPGYGYRTGLNAGITHSF